MKFPEFFYLLTIVFTFALITDQDKSHFNPIREIGPIFAIVIRYLTKVIISMVFIHFYMLCLQFLVIRNLTAHSNCGSLPL